MSDKTHEIKSNAKLCIETLQEQFESNECGIPSGVRGGYLVALRACHNAVNGGSTHPESLNVAVGAIICAMATDKLEQRAQTQDIVRCVVAELLPTLVAQEQRSSCPLRDAPLDSQGRLNLRDLSPENGISFSTKFFNLSAKGRVAATLVGAAILVVAALGTNFWLNSKLEGSAERGAERAVERIAERAAYMGFGHGDPR